MFINTEASNSWSHSFLCVIISSKLTLLIGTSYLPDWSLVTDPCFGDRHLACDAVDVSQPSEFKFVWPWLILISIPLPLFCSFPLGFQNLEFYILSSTILSYFTLLFPWKVLLILSKHTLLYVSSVSLTFLKYFEQNLLRQLILCLTLLNSFHAFIKNLTFPLHECSTVLKETWVNHVVTNRQSRNTRFLGTLPDETASIRLEDNK